MIPFRIWIIIHKNKLKKILNNILKYSECEWHSFATGCGVDVILISLMANLTWCCLLRDRQLTLSIACVVDMKNTTTRQIRQIHCKWKQKPRFSCDSIWSAAYHLIACGATQRFHTKHICLAHDPAAMQQPGQPGDSRARWNALLKKISHGAEETTDRRWDWCNAVSTVCRRSLGNENAEAVITLWFQMALSRMCIASAWMCALMISSRWWFTWWYLIACHHLTCRTNCAVLIRTEYQRSILHVIVLMFSFF